MKKRILIVDDHPIMRHGLAQLIRAEPDLELSDSVGTAAAGLEAVERDRPDLVVVDLTLPDKHGLELIKDMQAMHPEVKLLVLSMHDEFLYAERVLRAGACGYVMKETAADTLVQAARRVLGGGLYLSERMSCHMLQLVAGHKADLAEKDPLERLTDRELEVLEMIGQGKATRHIAAQLNISTRTVDAHRSHIKEKLQLADGPSLVRYAVKWVEGKRGAASSKTAG